MKKFLRDLPADLKIELCDEGGAHAQLSLTPSRGKRGCRRHVVIKDQRCGAHLTLWHT